MGELLRMLAMIFFHFASVVGCHVDYEFQS